MKESSLKSDIGIISAQYFLYFGVLGFFLPYFNLYCYRIGFSGVEIGTLSSVRSITVIIFPLLWGRIADHLGCRKQIFVICIFACSLIWSLYLLTANFRFMVLITFFYGVFYAPLVSFLETFSIELLGPEKQGYGRIRAWGSASFIVAVLITGQLIEIYSERVILGLILAGSAAQALLSLKMPAASEKKTKVFAAGNQSLLSWAMARFLICVFLMLTSHGAYYGFFSIHLENMGFNSSFIGLCWTVAVAAEILVMIKSKLVFSRYSLEKVLVFSIACAAFRWLTLFMVESPLFILLSQAAHAITYGAFHMASILYVDRLSPGHLKTLGQAVNNAVSYGIGLTAGFFVNGYFYEKFGSRYLFLFGAMTAALAGLIFILPIRDGRKG